MKLRDLVPVLFDEVCVLVFVRFADGTVIRPVYSGFLCTCKDPDLLDQKICSIHAMGSGRVNITLA